MKRLSLSNFFSLLASNGVNVPGLWPVCSQNQAWSCIHPIQFHSSKEGMDHIVQNQPGSNLDALVRAWPNTCGLKASQCAGITRPRFWQDATGLLPVSHFQTRGVHSSTDILDRIVQNLNQPGTYLVLADCQVFAKQIWFRSEPVCKNHLACFWPTLLSQSRPDANQIQHVYWEDCSSLPLSVDPTFLTWCHSETLPAYLSPRMDLWKVVCALNVKWAVICPVMCIITCTCRLVIIRCVIFSFIVSLIAQSMLIQLLN